METPLDQPVLRYLHRPTSSPAQHRVVGCTVPIDENVAREDAIGWYEIKPHRCGSERCWIKVPKVGSQAALGEQLRHTWVEPKAEEPIVDQTLLASTLGRGAVPRPMSEAAFSPAEGTSVGLSQPMREKPLLRPLGSNHNRAQSRGVGVGPKRASVS